MVILPITLPLDGRPFGWRAGAADGEGYSLSSPSSNCKILREQSPLAPRYDRLKNYTVWDKFTVNNFLLVYISTQHDSDRDGITRRGLFP